MATPSFSKLTGAELKSAINGSRCDPSTSRGFYESYFLRANHPTEAQALWVRYTIFIPRGRPQGAKGQIWGIFFDADAEAVAGKTSLPLSDCAFSRSKLQARIGAAALTEAEAAGGVDTPGGRLEWNLGYRGDGSPSYLLPLGLYEGGFPKAKALTGIPLAEFSGSIRVGSREVDLTGWTGSQNHNWGEKHTDQYAWGQVCGFDDAPDAFLECSTARVGLGPVRTPWLTNVVLRLADRDIRLNSIPQGLRNRGRYTVDAWTIDARRGPLSVHIRIGTPRERFVGLAYNDPPGGTKTCLNTKLASADVRVVERGRPTVELATRTRAAFEVLAPDAGHGVPIAV